MGENCLRWDPKSQEASRESCWRQQSSRELARDTGEKPQETRRRELPVRRADTVSCWEEQKLKKVVGEDWPELENPAEFQESSCRGPGAKGKN